MDIRYDDVDSLAAVVLDLQLLYLAVVFIENVEDPLESVLMNFLIESSAIENRTKSRSKSAVARRMSLDMCCMRTQPFIATPRARSDLAMRFSIASWAARARACS